MTRAELRELRSVDRHSPLLTAWEYGAATAVQGRTLDGGATRDAWRGYSDAREAIAELAEADEVSQ